MSNSSTSVVGRI